MNMLSDIECIVFDLDDTLYPERQFVLSGYRAVAEHLVSYGVNPDEAFKSMKQILISEGRTQVFDKYLRRKGMDTSLVYEMLEVYRNHKPHIALYDDAKRFIEHIYGKYMLGLITDGLAIVQWNKIKTLDIKRYFDIIVVTDEHGKDWTKPSLLPYMYVEKKLLAVPQKCVYIADNPNKDFIGAKKLGWYTVRVDRGNGEYSGYFLDEQHEAELVVSDLMQLYDFLIEEG